MALQKEKQAREDAERQHEELVEQLRRYEEEMETARKSEYLTDSVVVFIIVIVMRMFSGVWGSKDSRTDSLWVQSIVKLSVNEGIKEFFITNCLLVLAFILHCVCRQIV